ncbi:MAG: hypothetical protein WA510_19660, partial [Acidobacteriaceae bacterium]
GGSPAEPGKPVGGPSSTPADTAFPIAESEGLAPPPKPSPVPPKETHAQVTVPLTYNGENPKAVPPAAAAATPPEQSPPAQTASAPPSNVEPTPEPTPEPAPEPAPEPTHQAGFLHGIGHFFARIFGK